MDGRLNLTLSTLLWLPRASGVWMEEPKPWATLVNHDSVIFHDNDFEVQVDLLRITVLGLASLQPPLTAHPLADLP